MVKRIICGAMLVGLLVAALGCTTTGVQTAARSAEPVFITFYGGPSTSGWYIVAAKMAEIVQQKVPNVKASGAVGQPVQNTRLVEAGTADIGTDTAYLVHAGLQGQQPFEKPLTNVTALSVLYPSFFQVFARADAGVESLADLKGKRVAVGAAGTSNDRVTQNMLSLYGLSYDEIRKSGGSISFSSYGDAKELMANKQLDVITTAGPFPTPFIVELQLTQKIKLVKLEPEKVEAYVKAFKGFGASKVPANTYKDQPYESPTISILGVLVVRKDLPEELVYQVTKAIWENKDEVVQSYPPIKADFIPANAVKYLEIPLHAGSARYYKEIRVLQQ